MTTCLRFGIVLVVTAGFAAGGTWIARELAKDGCLDRGGAWNEKQARCDRAAG